MTDALLIDGEYLRKYTMIGGSVDENYFEPAIRLAQDKQLQTWLGSRLLEKLRSIVAAGTVDQSANAAYKTLLRDYVRPALARYTLVELYPNLVAKIENANLVKRTSDDTSSLTQAEVSQLVNAERTNAQFYTQRLIDYLCLHQSDFVEYTTFETGDIHPRKKPYDESSFMVI